MLTLRLEILLVLLFSLPAVVLAQANKRSHVLDYGFVSPNTREDLKIHDAIREMGSNEEARLIEFANNLHCVVRAKIHVYRALGSWSDGAEHTLLLRVKTGQPTVRYLLSQLGRDTQQKAVLYFHPQAGGSASIYRLRLKRREQLAEVAEVLDQVGIAFRTLVPGRRRTTVYVVDLKRELQDKVMVAAKRLKAHLVSQRGKADFIGADTRLEAKSVFDTEIGNYEKSHPNLPARCR
jgi:hypothetical protein